MNRRAPTEGTVLDRFYLARLERFVRLAHRADAAVAAPWHHLARQAALAAYRDCLALGLERQAREILARTFGR
ncbi:MAG TPA: hypothetical protein VG370_27970 [Chloroflexota bacterium]|nr:hypothetical protein [Chloroflexota bacterium]